MYGYYQYHIPAGNKGIHMYVRDSSQVLRQSQAVPGGLHGGEIRHI